MVGKCYGENDIVIFYEKILDLKLRLYLHAAQQLLAADRKKRHIFCEAKKAPLLTSAEAGVMHKRGK